MEKLYQLTDKELYRRACFFGAEARKWSRKFAALLPEVEKRQLYKKYKFYSIFEFAAKLAGIGRETVLEVLRVARKLEDKPLLLEQLEKQGVNKLRVVANIANKENEKMLAEKVQEMSKPTLQVFVREMQNGSEYGGKFRAGPEFDKQTMENRNRQQPERSEGPKRISITFPLEPIVELRFRELQKKLSKQDKEPVDFNGVLETLLNVYDSSNEGGKKRKTITEINQENLETMKNEVNEILEKRPVGCRYIPTKEKQFLYQKYESRCAYPECLKLPEIFHHTRRFALNPSHDPDFVVPLCKEHERLAHLGLIENEEKPPEMWRLKTEREKAGAKYSVDRKVNEFRTTNYTS